MAKKLDEIPETETPLEKLENRVFVLEALLQKHLQGHYGGVVRK